MWKPSLRSRIEAGVAAAFVGGALIFGSFGSTGGPLGTGQRTISAQPSGSLAARSGMLAAPLQETLTLSSTAVQPTAAQILRSEQAMARPRAAMAARAAALPAVDARVQPQVPPDPATETIPPARHAAAPYPAAFSAFRMTQLNPASGGLTAAGATSPAVAQNGMHVFYTFNWGAARSVNGGTSWSYINPFSTMPDFCCEQDAIYDKETDRMFWLRQGVNSAFGCGTGCNENRDLIGVSADGGATFCTYDIRPSTLGLTNREFSFLRLSLSTKYLYLLQNVLDSSSGGYVTHALTRFKLTDMMACGPAPFNAWTFNEGWMPGLVEGARDTMFMGDTIVTNGNLNDQFRVSWIFDDSTTLNFVDRTIASYLFSGVGATCPVLGLRDPCQKSDQRVTGVISHNSPSPQGLGASGDRVDFYWDVRGGNGIFVQPYIEAAGFHGGTIAYGSRKYIFANNAAFQHMAVAANERGSVGATMMWFHPSFDPDTFVGIDDDENGNPPPWEVNYGFGSETTWSANDSGRSLRVRMYNPVGTVWVAANYIQASGQFKPYFMVFGRDRDANGFNRFDQK